MGKAAAIAGMAGAALLALLNGSPRDWLVNDTGFATEIHRSAARHGLPPELVRALIFQESRFDPFARGRKGEIGLMQVIPSSAVADWARAHKAPEPAAAELFEPRLNIEIGCWYLGRALRRWSGYRHRIELALAHYNAGESRAKRWKPEKRDGEVLSRISIPGTRDYVKRIMKRYHAYLRTNN